MQISKNQKDVKQLLKRIEKVKIQINSASAYAQLQKCSSKLQKIREKVSALLDKKSRKELKQMIKVVEDLIHFKTMKFKKNIIDKISKNSTSIINNDHEKTLKYSKSMDNIDLQNAIQPMNAKNDESQLWNGRSQANISRNKTSKIQQRVFQLEDELSTYKRKIKKLESTQNDNTISHVCSRFGEQDALFEQQMSFKLKQKRFQIDELKDRLKRSEQKQTQLKNRLLNEQKRQQDYIQNLKNHIGNLTLDVETLTKQNKKLQEQSSRSQYTCESLQAEIKKLMQEIQYLHRERKQLQQNQIMKMKDNNIKKELQTLSMQQKYLREMESLLLVEREEKNILIEKLQHARRKLAQVEQQNFDQSAENQRMGEVLEIKCEEIGGLKAEIFRCTEEKSKIQSQLADSKSQLLRLKGQMQIVRQRRNQQLLKKSQNLKQIKQILENQ